MTQAPGLVTIRWASRKAPLPTIRVRLQFLVGARMCLATSVKASRVLGERLYDRGPGEKASLNRQSAMMRLDRMKGALKMLQVETRK